MGKRNGTDSVVGEPPAKLKDKEYCSRTGKASCRARKAPGMDQGHGRQDLHLFRGPGRRRQGRRDQGHYRKGQP